MKLFKAMMIMNILGLALTANALDRSLATIPCQQSSQVPLTGVDTKSHDESTPGTQTPSFKGAPRTDRKGSK